MLVLAPRPSGCVGVDLDSGAFVRAGFPAPVGDPFAPLDLVAGEVGGPIDPPDPSQPEAVHRLERRHMGAHDMARVLGFRSGLVLVVLSEPHDGYYWKEVAALLPGS